MVSRTVVFFLTALGTLFSYVATIIFLYLFVRYVFLKSQASIEVQAALKFYILMEIVNGFIVSFNLTHSCLIYKIEDAAVYVTQLLFWDVALQNTIVIIRPIAILILGLDKLFIILFPAKAEYKRKTFSFFIGINLMVISSMLFLVYRILPNIPTDIFITSCVSFNCIGKLGNSTLFFTVKTVLGFMDFVLGIILLMILNKKYKMMNVVRAKHRNIVLVIVTLFITIMLNFLPNLIGLLFLIVSCWKLYFVTRRISDNRS